MIHYAAYPSHGKVQGGVDQQSLAPKDYLLDANKILCPTDPGDLDKKILCFKMMNG